ncbi:MULTISPECIES: hypothetical protein [Streptomyces]|uniref:Uncharacterized protein n=1 Tax=Streptomyces nigrescens TaxID=1920 RepID=A0A640TA81_STRNI|nr:hypothetical protein [Streptomyces libani]WAT94931.1 hypothetical protein STRLI_000603 [Streptomyces libani subsp. libani]GFE20080.1 hypothetical protein Sliba_05330 [Streptomyces libani subsp. libani]GGV85791.1 hypothetical protein GCM10010500_02860 [Streptomyces libani subsp. libani]
MTGSNQRFEVPEPHPECDVRLPGNGGVVHGRIKIVDQRSKGNVWILVALPCWTRWSTQIEVGEPTHEGIAPGVEDTWVPAFAVETEDDVYTELKQRYRKLKSVS